MTLRAVLSVIALVCGALLASLDAARASTVFDITGNSNYSGTLTIYTVAGDLTAADVVIGTPPDFTFILSKTQGSSEFSVGISNTAPLTTTTTGPILSLSFDDGGTL